jgi:adenosylhomocysteine nucleosidase
MLLIAAALQEELKVALSHYRNPEKIRRRGVEFWQAVRNHETVYFLKTGIGPKRSAASMERALEIMEVSQILVLGYAGALDPQLKLGTLVVVEKAFACSIDKARPEVEHLKLDKIFVLAPGNPLVKAAKSLHLPFSTGNTLTSSHVWGNPEHKKILLEKFQASVVDMETAALAGVSETKGIPLRCIRAISDEAGDSFLEPFSYNPSPAVARRTGQLIRKGNPVKILREWKCNTSVARVSLDRFLAGYLCPENTALRL